MTCKYLSIQSACFIAVVNARLNFTSYRLLAEWLGGYSYVLPVDRFVSDKLTVLLFNNLIERLEPPMATHLLNCYVNILECNIPAKYQHELIEYFSSK